MGLQFGHGVNVRDVIESKHLQAGEYVGEVGARRP